MATFSSKLYIWEVHGAINECKLLKRSIELPEDIDMAPFTFTFYTDGSIMFMNCYADVYNVERKIILKWYLYNIYFFIIDACGNASCHSNN